MKEDADPDSKTLRRTLGGIRVLSWLGISVRQQAYMAFGLWVTQYAMWTVLGREMSETGPVFKPMLFLWLRNVFSVAVLVPVALRAAGGVRAFLPAPKDVPLVLLLGSTIWGNQFFYIYVRSDPLWSILRFHARLFFCTAPRARTLAHILISIVHACSRVYASRPRPMRPSSRRAFRCTQR